MHCMIYNLQYLHDNIINLSHHMTGSHICCIGEKHCKGQCRSVVMGG